MRTIQFKITPFRTNQKLKAMLKAKGKRIHALNAFKTQILEMVENLSPLIAETSQKASELASYVSASMILPDAISTNLGKFPPESIVETQLPYNLVCKNAERKGKMSKLLFKMIKTKMLPELNLQDYKHAYLQMLKSRDVIRIFTFRFFRAL
jgi:hypothetical protein